MAWENPEKARVSRAAAAKRREHHANAVSRSKTVSRQAEFGTGAIIKNERADGTMEMRNALDASKFTPSLDQWSDEALRTVEEDRLYQQREW